MTIIPVIDLLQGRAVQAQAGLREAYPPLHSSLCRNGEVMPLINRLHEEFGCNLIYFADLDAILGNGDNTALLARIAADLPCLDMWLDGGFHEPADIDETRQRLEVRPVIGSESWLHTGALPEDNLILSVDMDGSGLRDPSGICGDPIRRPKDLILMNLNRIGSRQGPDLQTLGQWRREAPSARLYAAGGIRNGTDLTRLKAEGAAGVLLASALHHGSLSPSDLARFS